MTVKSLTRINEVRQVRKPEQVNALLNDGWVLLAVASVAVEEGHDSWVLTEFTVGFPGRDALDD